MEPLGKGYWKVWVKDMGLSGVASESTLGANWKLGPAFLQFRIKGLGFKVFRV